MLLDGWFIFAVGWVYGWLAVDFTNQLLHAAHKVEMENQPQMQKKRMRISASCAILILIKYK